jgi:hypothetical protein
MYIAPLQQQFVAQAISSEIAPFAQAAPQKANAEMH